MVSIGIQRNQENSVALYRAGRDEQDMVSRAGVAESVVMEIGGWKTRSVFLRYDIVNSKDRKMAMEQLEQQRLAHEHARTENGHNFSHNSLSEATEQAELQNARTN